jgi:copper(I)-binding protein
LIRRLAAATVVLARAGAAAAHEVKAGALTLSNLQVRASIGTAPNSAAYLTIGNAGAADDRLVSVACACAVSAMVHRSQTKDGVTTMDMAGAVIVPAHGEVAFSPNGLHIMLTGLKAPLKAGGMQEMILKFQHAGTVKAGFHVRDVIGTPQGGKADMPGMKP